MVRVSWSVFRGKRKGSKVDSRKLKVKRSGSCGLNLADLGRGVAAPLRRTRPAIVLRIDVGDVKSKPAPFKAKGAAPKCRRVDQSCGLGAQRAAPLHESVRVIFRWLELGVGAVDFGEELLELGAIFFAGAGFGAAGNVYGVGADVEDGVGDIFGGESAGEDDAMSFSGAAGDGPVGAMAGAAVFAGFGGVEKERAY